MSEIYSIINGELVVKNEASILISDLSIQRGYGIFDFFITTRNQPVFLEDHLDRFFHSAKKMNLEDNLTRTEIKQLINSLINKNNIPDSGIRITLTGGYAEDGFTPAKPNLLITQNEFHLSKEVFNKGIRLITFEHQRQMPDVKTIDYLMAIYLQPFIKEKKADDVLYFHQNKITECPRANFFIVTKNDEVLTPPDNILNGITRKKILEFTGFNLAERDITPEDLKVAKEAFITSSTKNVLPVLEINGRITGTGKPGRITTEIYQRMSMLRENI